MAPSTPPWADQGVRAALIGAVSGLDYSNGRTDILRLYRPPPTTSKGAAKPGTKTMSEAIEIVEVGARDGLQNEKAVLDVDDKVEFVRRLEACGARRIEAVSFVNPRRVPQMAGAEEIMAPCRRNPAGSASAWCSTSAAGTAPSPAAATRPMW